MIIKRTVDGKEMTFKLTEQELFNAFEEQEHIWDVNAVESYVCMYTDEDYMDAWNITKEQFTELIPDIAYRLRRYVIKYDMSEESALNEALQDVIDENYGS